MSKYILDTNVLITAYRVYYPFDIVPSFWENLLSHANQQDVVLVDLVVEEIMRGGDALYEWLHSNLSCFTVLKSDKHLVIKAYQTIIQEIVNDTHYTEKAKADFADVADSWLIAHAYANNYIVVTEETFDINSKKRVKIPNVCRKYNIPYTNTIGLLRSLGIKM